VRMPRLTRVSEGKPRRRLLIDSKAHLIVVFILFHNVSPCCSHCNKHEVNKVISVNISFMVRLTHFVSNTLCVIE
jgi:hypothetical protein